MKHIALLISAALLMVGCGVSATRETSADRSGLTRTLDSESSEMLDLLLKYIAVESGSRESTDGSFPLTGGQMEMARLLKSDLDALGIHATLSEYGYVYADIPSNLDRDVPVAGLSCHLDITPEAPNVNIKPYVITYTGGDIQLADGNAISPQNPDGEALPGLIGKTLIHSDGTTLLGGDDKNGCAIVMSVLKALLDSGVKHGRVQAVIAPNEELGKAAEKIDTALFNPDILFDVDGGGGHKVTASNFTARGMKVKFTGKDAHASEAKRQRYGDALAAAATYIANVPLQYRPEQTEGLEGYIHHWNLTGDKVHHEDTVYTRIRYFDSREGELFDRIIRESLAKVRTEFPNVQVDVLWDETQYDNVEYAMHPASREIIGRAAERCGQHIEFVSERGGTTAAMLTAKGLKGGLCIFSGQYNAHTVREFSVLEDLLNAYHLLLTAVDEITALPPVSSH